jgi:CheY-like chemotaxis protein
VLVIDDDTGVRDAFRRALEQAGFAVETAANGREALAATSQAGFRAIVCDLKMPSLSGLGVYAVLHELFPAVAARIIFVTGFRHDPQLRQFLASTGRPVLDKPVEIADLVRVVRNVVGQGQQKMGADKAT